MRFLTSSDASIGFTDRMFSVDPTLTEGGYDPHTNSDQRLADAIMNTLQQHYPGHPWFVEVSHHRNVGIAKIKLPGFTDYSFILKIRDLVSDPGLKSVVAAGGQFLERYRLPRSGIDYASYLASMAKYGGLFRRKLKPPE